MSAGDSIDHYCQDAAEAYLVWKLQECAEIANRAIVVDAESKRIAFENYVRARSIEATFSQSEYKKNVDAVVLDIFRDLERTFGGELFRFIDVEKEYRDLKRKGDLEIHFSGKPRRSVSVKNYKNGFARIQLCSGTWNSFLNNFLFESVGVGTFVNPRDGSTFSGADRDLRNTLARDMGMSALIEFYDLSDRVLDDIRNYYVHSDAARFWQNISERWKRDCVRYGTEAAVTLVRVLAAIPKDTVRKRLLSMAGLNFEEEILLLGRGRYLCSLFNEKYRHLLDQANAPGGSVCVSAAGQTVTFVLLDESKNRVLDLQVPFTLQKNGAWHLPKEAYEGKIYHAKENTELAYGERRPKKSKELNTSTNTYLDLVRIGIL